MHVLSVIQHQPHRAGTDLRRELVACLAHGSTFSRVGASGKPGAVHLDIFRSIQNTNQLELLCDGHPPTWGGRPVNAARPLSLFVHHHRGGMAVMVLTARAGADLLNVPQRGFQVGRRAARSISERWPAVPLWFSLSRFKAIDARWGQPAGCPLTLSGRRGGLAVVVVLTSILGRNSDRLRADSLA
jgi:hypothetical protein